LSTVTLIQAQPRFAASGAVADIRLAGGGTQAYFQLGFGDWRSGIARPPRFSTAIGFDQRGLTGGALPSTGGFEFSSSDKALFSALGGMVWEGARVTVTTGDDEDVFPDYVAQLVGTVAAVKTDKATLSFVIADLSIDLDKPVIVGTFSGSGALEGGDDAVGRPKRRSWGPVFGIEGRLLDKAYNVYEFGDPAYPLQAFKALKDKGRTGDMVLVPWQGSGLATLNALRAAQTPSGGGAVAPSIACAKWWTTPAGPLTADLEGEVGAGYVGSAVAIAARIALTYSTAIRIDEASRATAETWPVAVAPAGLHCAETSESVANFLDRLLLPLSIVWILDGAGQMAFRRLTWANPVERLRADTIKREAVFKPLKTRRYGYQRNYRPHAESEISAAIPADEILFPDGSTAADLADIVADLDRDLEAVVSDAVLSRVEKPIWIDRYDEIIAQQTALNAKYVALGSPPELGDAKNAATAFVNALKLYLDGLTPSWRDTKTDTAIVKDDFAGYWRNAIAAIAQYVAAITGRPGKDAPLVLTQWSINGVDGWHDNYMGADVYARQSNNGGATWGPAERRIGESGTSGEYTSFVFKRSSTIPDTPATNTGNPPPGWSDAPPVITGFLFQSKATFRGSTQLTPWSAPVRITGDQGEKGNTGNDGFSLIASPPAFVVPSFANGTSKEVWKGGSCRIALYKGGQEVSADSYNYVAASNIASIGMNGQNVTFADVVGDKGEFTVRATRAGITYDLRVTVVRTKDGNPAFKADANFSLPNGGSGSGSGSAPVPGGRTLRINANAIYGAPLNTEGRGVLSIYWQNLTTGGPLNLLGQIAGSTAYTYNTGTVESPVYERKAGSAAIGAEFVGPADQSQVYYQVSFQTDYGQTSDVSGLVSLEVL